MSPLLVSNGYKEWINVYRVSDLITRTSALDLYVLCSSVITSITTALNFDKSAASGFLKTNFFKASDFTFACEFVHSHKSVRGLSVMIDDRKWRLLMPTPTASAPTRENRFERQTQESESINWPSQGHNIHPRLICYIVLVQKTSPNRLIRRSTASSSLSKTGCRAINFFNCVSLARQRVPFGKGWTFTQEGDIRLKPF